MNCEDIINEVPNAKEIEKELTNLFSYLGLKNRIEINATYNKNLYYSVRMTVEFLSKEDEIRKEKENRLLINVEGF